MCMWAAHSCFRVFPTAYKLSLSFQWVFKQVLQALHTAPRVIFTNSDPAMAWSIQQILSTTCQLSSALDVVCQAIHTATSTQADMPCISAISDCLTGHALEIVRSQQAHQQAYTIELQCIAHGCPNPAAGVYKVSRQANPNKKTLCDPQCN